MPLAYFLNAPTAKVGKSARRNLRFLHFRARYTLYGIVGACRTFTQDFLFRFDKRTVSAPAPLPLTSTPKNTVGSTVRRRDALIAPPYNALFSTVDIVSGSGARRKSIRHTKRNQPCSANAWQKITSLQNEQRARILKPQV